MSNFPTSAPSFSNPSGSDYLNSPAHATQHSTANDEIVAIAAKVGIDGSVTTTTHDYKLSGVTGSNKAFSTGNVDTDNTLAADSDTKVPSQKAVKAYVDGLVTASPSFLVHKNGTDQSFSASTYTKVTWSTESFDTNNNFASSTFTPTVAGKYLLTTQLRPTAAADGNILYCLIYKNGVSVAQSELQMSGSNPQTATVTTIQDANGSTDYFDVYVWYDKATPSVDGPADFTFFSGVKVS